MSENNLSNDKNKIVRPSNRLDLMSTAEKIITDAVGEIERMGADVRLTEAQILLRKARDLVYDYLENK